MRQPTLKLQSYIALAIAGLLASSAVLATTYTFRVTSPGLKATNPLPLWAVTGSPATVFASANIGEYASPDLVIPVKNTGSGGGSLGSLVFSGANPGDFSETSNCTNIAPNASCAITVRFNPAAANDRAAVLTVGTNPLNFTGTGVALPVGPLTAFTYGFETGAALPPGASYSGTINSTGRSGSGGLYAAGSCPEKKNYFSFKTPAAATSITVTWWAQGISGGYFYSLLRTGTGVGGATVGGGGLPYGWVQKSVSGLAPDTTYSLSIEAGYNVTCPSSSSSLDEVTLTYIP